MYIRVADDKISLDSTKLRLKASLKYTFVPTKSHPPFPKDVS